MDSICGGCGEKVVVAIRVHGRTFEFVPASSEQRFEGSYVWFIIREGGKGKRQRYQHLKPHLLNSNTQKRA